MSRRRALIGAYKATNLIYSLYNHATVAGDMIDTLIAPFEAGVDMTLLMDITIPESPPFSGNASQYKLVSVKPWQYFFIGKTGSYTAVGVAWQNVETSGVLSASHGHIRYAIIHEANSDNLIIKQKIDNGTVTNKTFTQTFTENTRTLSFGYSAETVHSLPTGTINLAEIYNTILSNEEINSFFT